MTLPTIQIDLEEAARLIVAIEWTEGEGQSMRLKSEGRTAPELEKVNAAHDRLRNKLLDFVDEAGS